MGVELYEVLFECLLTGLEEMVVLLPALLRMEGAGRQEKHRFLVEAAVPAFSVGLLNSSGKGVPVDHLCLASSDVDGLMIGAKVLYLAGDSSEEGCTADHYLWLLSQSGGFVVVAVEWASVDKSFVARALMESASVNRASGDQRHKNRKLSG